MPSFYFSFCIGLLCLFHCTTAPPPAVTGREMMEDFKMNGEFEDIAITDMPSCIQHYNIAAGLGGIDRIADSIIEDFKLGYGTVDFPRSKIPQFLAFMKDKIARTSETVTVQKANRPGFSATAYRIKGTAQLRFDHVAGMPAAPSDTSYKFETYFFVNVFSKLIYAGGDNPLWGHPSGLASFAEHLRTQEIPVPSEISVKLTQLEKEAQEAQSHNL